MAYPIFTGDVVNILLPATEDPTFKFIKVPEIKFAASDFDRLTVKGYRIIFTEDLARIITTGVTYSTGVYNVAGNGVLEFKWEHKTDKLNTGGKNPLVNDSGYTGTWEFSILVPATNSVPAFDTIKKYTGSFTVIGNLDLATKISF